ncbi:MAG: ABC transporter ATP-binding protein, partial [Lachnospiraceae bacterium]|nr:ABC transporter ATP-binding protein [Lachnospiraceae bacterium]
NNFKAIDDISFKIEEGEIVGFLGPNGAGKSTTMSIITGYIEPTKGKIIVNGYDISQKAKQAKRQIGYMPENVPLYSELTVKEFIAYMADLKLVKRKEKKSEIERVLKQTGLTEVKSKLIRNLSRGYKQRVSLAGALIGNPPILILDEPTVGLDPKQVTEIRNLIKSLKEKHTILISSHILSEINQMCNKIIIINNGKIVKIDKTENIEAETQNNNSDTKELIITVEEQNIELPEIAKKIKAIKSITLIDQNDNEKNYSIHYEGNEEIRKDLLKMCIDKDINIIEIKKKEISLEDAFLKIIDETASDNSKKGGKK